MTEQTTILPNGGGTNCGTPGFVSTGGHGDNHLGELILSGQISDSAKTNLKATYDCQGNDFLGKMNVLSHNHLIAVSKEISDFRIQMAESVNSIRNDANNKEIDRLRFEVCELRRHVN